MNFWNIFQSSWLKNIFKKETATTNSYISLKKDDDYEYNHHLAVMQEIDKYKKYNLQNLPDSDIEIIAEDIYSLIKDSGELYYKSDMFYEELREIKKVLLLEDIRIRSVLFRLICETEDLIMFKGLWSLEFIIKLAEKQTAHKSLSSLKKNFGDDYF